MRSRQPPHIGNKELQCTQCTPDMMYTVPSEPTVWVSEAFVVLCKDLNAFKLTCKCLVADTVDKIVLDLCNIMTIKCRENIILQALEYVVLFAYHLILC